ncbi:MAG TPA: biotin carboxylase N-terminal domain-containing protein [Acidimicrobiales bacterium]|nr:biotin carboxylase N-terminal domain-containing protein [Acidimicrobiales bacterium]
MLIANRGEIALRVIRACRKLGLECVVATTPADRDSLAAELADRAVCIGGNRPAESYLRVEAIVSAAIGTHCDAVHPGYGFLSESPALARACADTGLRFVGPRRELLETFGDKVAARAAAEAAGLPTARGSGPLATAEEAASCARDVGFPLLLKAVAGGGGRGLRLIEDASQLALEFSAASAEAAAAFGDSRLYLESFVPFARHVEVQIASDGQGATVHFGDRDCSIQRRNQKLIEEAPAPFLAAHLQQAIRDAAVRLMRTVNYDGLGTVEFIVDPARDAFYFLEVNPRLQVEHGITELVTGWDLVALQLALAAGTAAPPLQREVEVRGSAIECRINAEDPTRNFQPSPGRVSSLQLPGGPGVRVDSSLRVGSAVPPFYDSLVMKVMAHGRTRAEAIAVLAGALRELRIGGITTTAGLQARILASTAFAAGAYSTRWLEEHSGLVAASTNGGWSG